jgi:hypothetical protein
MEYIGIDVHQRESQVCIVDERGQVLIERRVRTSRERFAALLGARAGARVLVESRSSPTSSRCCARRSRCTSRPSHSCSPRRRDCRSIPTASSSCAGTAHCAPRARGRARSTRRATRSSRSRSVAGARRSGSPSTAARRSRCSTSTMAGGWTTTAGNLSSSRRGRRTRAGAAQNRDQKGSPLQVHDLASGGGEIRTRAATLANEGRKCAETLAPQRVMPSYGRLHSVPKLPRKALVDPPKPGTVPGQRSRPRCRRSASMHGIPPILRRPLTQGEDVLGAPRPRPGPAGSIVAEVDAVAREHADVPPTTRELPRLADWLTVAAGCTPGALESTRVSWRPVYDLLEGRFDLAPVNAREQGTTGDLGIMSGIPDSDEEPE